jgi:hypothetical protein
MKIKKEHAPLVDRLFKMTVADNASRETIKELTRAYIGQAQVDITCWTCPGSVAALYKRLCQMLSSYEVESEQIISNETNESPASPAVEGDNKQKEKKFKSGRKHKDL